MTQAKAKAINELAMASASVVHNGIPSMEVTKATKAQHKGKPSQDGSGKGKEQQR